MQQETIPSSRGISFKSAASYALLPGILSNLQNIALRLSGFLFLFTQMLGAVGLIERSHPCLRTENIGRYRFIDILGMAAGNLVFDRKHLPQIIMFFSIVATLLLVVGFIFALLAMAMLNIGQANAQLFGMPTDNGYTRDSDWSLQFLYRIFGISSFFPAPTLSAGRGNPWFTALLVGMLKYYSLAILVVATFMIIYMLVMSLTEAARSGKPFGSNFDSIWAPVRIALAVGLLVPIASPGYNGAQLFVFQAAVWGSNLATNTWYGGLNAIKGKDGEKFFAASMSDPGYRFVRDMFLVNLCLEGLKQANHKAWGIASMDMAYVTVAYNDKIVYDFGPVDVPGYCGQVTVSRRFDSNVGPVSSGDDNWIDRVGKDYQTIAKMFLPVPHGVGTGMEIVRTVAGVASGGHLSGFTELPATMAPAVTYAAKTLMGTGSKDEVDFSTTMNTSPSPAVGAKPLDWIKMYWKQLGVTCADGTPLEDGKPCAGNARSAYFASGGYPKLVQQYNNWMLQGLLSDAKFGWTTAGVFYLRMSSAMSAISNVVNSPPTVTRLPSNLSKAFATADNPTANTTLTAEQCSGFWSSLWANWTNDNVCKKYELSLKMNSFLRGASTWFLQSVKNDSGAYALVDGPNYDRELQMSDPETSSNLQLGIIFRPIVDGLMSFAKIDSKDLHPLGAVVSWGNALINMAVVCYGLGLVLPGAMTKMAFMIGNLMMLPGFVLAFWIPMIPFMYFLFAVLEWMMSVLEAVIGMPLWALSMVTLKGDGLGDVATTGFKNIIEIILRPTIIVLALLISVIMFTASMAFFNSAIELYASAKNTGSSGLSFSPATLASSLGMIFIYMFGTYSLATSCFKLISVIPNSFGRWGGLPNGFGSMIKTGPEAMGQLSGFVAAGVGMKVLGGLTDSAAKGKENAEKKKSETKVKGKDGG